MKPTFCTCGHSVLQHEHLGRDACKVSRCPCKCFEAPEVPTAAPISPPAPSSEPPRYTLEEVRERLLEAEVIRAGARAACWPFDAFREGMQAALDRFEQEEGER